MWQDHAREARHDTVVHQQDGEQQPMSEWKAIDQRLREYARHRATLDAAELYDLARAEELKIHYLCGHAHMYEYMERTLGYAPHAARERMRVARAIRALPLTAAALARGELNYSGVRELTRVATGDTEAAWLAASHGMATNQIEKLVSGHVPGDRPEDPTTPDLRPRIVRLELPTEVYALWRQARKVIADERGTEISDADLVETMCRAVLAPGSGEAGPAHQIAYQQCPDCRRATQNGSGREIDVAPEVVARAGCDARVLGSLDTAAPERATQTVTPRVREQVFARDHGRCTVPGCRSARNLDIHHLVAQARGGTHDMENLTLLCSGHHAALHAGMMSMHGTPPHGLEVRWTYGAPMPAGLAPDERQAWIERRVQQQVDQWDAVWGNPRVSSPVRHDVPPGTRPARDAPTQEPSTSDPDEPDPNLVD